MGRQTATMSPDSVLRQLHTVKEWGEVRPTIERLYVQELRPLSAVMQLMETDYRFKASISAYKRMLRVWGLRKNSRPRTRQLTTVTHARRHSAPHYLAQNDADEALHSLLDLLGPWINQTGLPRYRDTRVFCPARAAYTYDDFAMNIAAAATSFESGDMMHGGSRLRQAFVDLEETLTPELRSMFTLQSFLFALATLNMAGLFDVSRLLITHATRLVVARTVVDIPIQNSNSVQHRLQMELGVEALRDTDHGRNIHHPFPQIMNRLQVLRRRSNDTHLTEAVFRAWSACSHGVRTELAMSLIKHRSRKEYWKSAFGGHGCPRLTYAELIPWAETIQPVLHYLNRMTNWAESRGNNDISHLIQDEIVAIYSCSEDEKFEGKALERVAGAEKSPVGWYASLDLAAYYQSKGDLDNAVLCLARLIPDHMGAEWKGALIEGLQEWKRSNLGRRGMNRIIKG